MDIGSGRRRRALRAAVAAAALAAPPAEPAQHPSLARRLLSQRDGFRTVSCEVRKETTGPGGRVALLSRVFFERPDRLNVENFSPLRRRIVCDGTNFCSYVEGAPRGFSRPVSELSADMRVELRRVPGTAGDVLLRVRDRPETALDPVPGYPVRRGYAGPPVFTVLALDERGRLARVAYYATAKMEQPLGHVDYADFEEVLPGQWVAMRRTGRSLVNGIEREETVRLSRYRVNDPIAPGLFRPSDFFPDVPFVPTFEALAAP